MASPTGCRLVNSTMPSVALARPEGPGLRRPRQRRRGPDEGDERSPSAFRPADRNTAASPVDGQAPFTADWPTYVLDSGVIETDYLVIGSGLAGLNFALRARRRTAGWSW